MYINWQTMELNLKVVYYGPPMSGKTTNLERIHETVDPTRRSPLVSLKTAEDRTLFFDFLQLELGRVSGLMPKIQLYTVPGQAYYEASRRLVLRGTDGIVFVADSNRRELNANLEAWTKLREHLQSLGLSLESLPVVVQFNKQDLAEALPVQVIRRLLHAEAFPCIGAVALRGVGVAETLKTITSDIVLRSQRRGSGVSHREPALAPARGSVP